MKTITLTFDASEAVILSEIIRRVTCEASDWGLVRKKDHEQMFVLSMRLISAADDFCNDRETSRVARQMKLGVRSAD